MLQVLVVDGELGVDRRPERRELALELGVVVHAVVDHGGEDVHRRLQVDLAFGHENADEVGQVAVGLLFLLKIHEISSVMCCERDGEDSLTLNEHRSYHEAGGVSANGSKTRVGGNVRWATP